MDFKETFGSDSQHVKIFCQQLGNQKLKLKVLIGSNQH
jgi:hypothetical protein